MARKKHRKAVKNVGGEVKDKGKEFKIKTVWLILGLAILVFVLFANTLSADHLVGSEPRHSDQITAGYSFKSFARESIKETGEFPLWNPYIFGGMPYVDAMHGDVFYLTMLLRFILPVNTVMALLFIIHIIVAGAGMLLFLRELGVRKPVALVGAVAFMFTGIIVSFVLAGHDSKVIVSSLLPWALLFIHRGFRLGKVLDFALLGLAFGLGLISPNVQMMYYTFLICGFYVLYRMYVTWKDKRKPWPVFKPFLYSIGSVAVGICISAVQMLPGISYLGFSPRAGGGRGWEFATSWALPRLELVDLLNPRFSGLLYNYWGANSFKLHAEYFGVLILALAIVGLIMAWRRRETKFFAGFSLFGILMALGAGTPFYYIPYYILPLIKSFRAPAMIFFTVAFCTVVLASLGLEKMLDRAGNGGREKKTRGKRRKINPGLIIVPGVGVILLILAIWSTAAPQGFAEGLLGSVGRTTRKSMELEDVSAKIETTARDAGTSMIELGINPKYDQHGLQYQMDVAIGQAFMQSGYSQYNPPSQAEIAYVSRIANTALKLGGNMENLANGFWLALIFVSAGFLIILAWGRFPKIKWLWGLLLACVVFLDLWMVDRHFTGIARDKSGNPISPQAYYAEDGVVAYLKRQPGQFRVLTAESRSVGPLYAHQNDAYLMGHDIQSAGGYHGNQLGRYQEFIGAPHTIMFQNAVNLRHQNFLTLLDVGYMIAIPIPDSTEMGYYDEQSRQVLAAISAELAPLIDSALGGSFQPEHIAGQNALYRNTAPHYRAWLATQVEVITDSAAILARISSPDFDPLQSVILEEKPEGWQPAPYDTLDAGRVQITRYEPNVIELTADARKPAVLVLSENWYPYYRAWVDGIEQKVYRADYTLRALTLTPGQHQVVFRFKSPYMAAGLWITILALGLVALGVVLPLVIKRKKKE